MCVCVFCGQTASQVARSAPEAAAVVEVAHAGATAALHTSDHAAHLAGVVGTAGLIAGAGLVAGINIALRCRNIRHENREPNAADALYVAEEVGAAGATALTGYAMHHYAAHAITQTLTSLPAVVSGLGAVGASAYIGHNLGHGIGAGAAHAVNYYHQDATRADPEKWARIGSYVGMAVGVAAGIAVSVLCPPVGIALVGVALSMLAAQGAVLLVRSLVRVSPSVCASVRNWFGW
jgi:hypothetical protein